MRVFNNDESYLGKKYGMLTVTGFTKTIGKYKDARPYWAWVCKCDCGKTTVVNPADVKAGKTRSCGCYHDAVCKERSKKFKHGTTENKRLYVIFNHMKQRCYKVDSPRYSDYGGRGIKICAEWMDSQSGFDRFVDWALSNGYADDLTIDRIDVDGDYSPQNCAWKTRKEQNNNKRETIWVEYSGEKIQLKKLCEREGVKYDTVHNRYAVLGWDIERSLHEPTPLETSFAKKCREHGMSESVVRDRISKLGWSEEEALNTPSAGRSGGAALANARRKNRICKVCGASFKPNGGVQIYCGEACRNKSKRVSYKKSLAVG